MPPRANELELVKAQPHLMLGFDMAALLVLEKITVIVEDQVVRDSQVAMVRQPLANLSTAKAAGVRPGLPYKGTLGQAVRGKEPAQLSQTRAFTPDG